MAYSNLIIESLFAPFGQFESNITFVEFFRGIFSLSWLKMRKAQKKGKCALVLLLKLG